MVKRYKVDLKVQVTKTVVVNATDKKEAFYQACKECPYIVNSKVEDAEKICKELDW